MHTTRSQWRRSRYARDDRNSSELASSNVNTDDLTLNAPLPAPPPRASEPPASVKYQVHCLNTNTYI
ncbi:unnamed protein product [Danaus chrysippus]|uniref:(African queen) hypothetical protein n=1 Tax=Danaus chrysippus TaxID=151541 RepID=A0A8J2QZV3_9NEOP|nr:unnamed protein product [Danaus chrysippus]